MAPRGACARAGVQIGERTRARKEPGLVLVKPDRTIYYASVQSMPFVRPAFNEMLKAIDFTIEHRYPARGEYVGSL